MSCNLNCGKCSDYKCKCADCFCLVEGEHGEWFCDEHEKPCEEVETCCEWE